VKSNLNYNVIFMSKIRALGTRDRERERERKREGGNCGIKTIVCIFLSVAANYNEPCLM
jgi:hypothetical protein